ncbi:MAG TPA: autotransporter-associated beta strand repeat-containing protein [Verrucomicrobiae bacterium]|nr:autotransporter-associated beta strand repeat-containing protein [Verrucomicrobiae bacterium]
MNKTVSFISCAALSFGLATIASAQTLAFPDAQGFGKYATGGRGGSVYYVTNLNDSGPGSFRMGVTSPNRTVVFAVGGVIRLSNVVSVAKNVTIAGQTAPGGGVTLYGHRLSFSGADNSITRFIRVRMGNHANGINSAATGDGNDTITIANGHDMIFDHVSVSWGQDETFSISGSDPTNITIQSTIIGQGLQDHSAGGLIQSAGGVSIVRSFYIDNNIRNPKVKFVNEFVNNVVYNWGGLAYILGGDSSGQSYANAFNNYFIDGPDSSSPPFSGGNLNFHLFATNNWQDDNLNGVLDGAVIPQADYGVVDWQTSPFDYAITNALPPLTALKLAISDVGMSWKRDVVDDRLLVELTSWGTLGETIYNEYETPMNGPGTVKNGTPYPDFDLDGLPDFWEAGLGLATNSPNNNDASPSGYTRLEDYLDWLADPHGVALTNTTVDIDLCQFMRGFMNDSPVYSLAGASNGIVTLLNGHIAQFIPTANFIGQAGFQFTVTDGDGSTLTRPMNLFFTPMAQTVNPIWRGDGATNNWNTLGDFNWFDGQSLLYPFHTGNAVTFDDSGSTAPAVNLIGSLQAAAVTIDAAVNYIFSGAGSLDGAMALVKTGTGSATLNTTNHFTGGTTVSNGTLLVNGALDQSTVSVKNGATIGGNGILGKSPALETGANIAPGGADLSGTLTISNALTESGGINNYFDLSDDPTGLSKTNDQIVIVGTLTASGKNIIRVNLPDGPLANGTYTLFRFANFIGSLTNFTLINANGILTNSPGEIDILVNNIRTPGNLTWLGGNSGNTWDNGTTTNWLNGGNADAFEFFDTVLFDDSGSATPAINLSGSVTPASVTFNATKNYTLGGGGKISGYGTFTKTNSGTLTITATNDYAGVTVLGGGVLSVPWLANSDDPGPFGAADSDPANLIFTGGVLQYTGANGSTDHGMTLDSNGGTLDVHSGATTLTLNGVVAGNGTLTKIGPGTLAMAGINSFSGGTVVTEGTLRLNTTTGTGGFGTGIVTLNGSTNSATFRFGGDQQILANTLNVTGTNNFCLLAGNDTLSDLIGSGTLHVITNSGTTFTMAGDMTGFGGTISADAIQNVRFNPSSGSSNAVFDMGNGKVLLNTRNGNLTIQLGALIGGANVTLQGASSANSFTTYVIGGRNLDTTFAGKISEVIPARTAAITKIGSGSFMLTGANTYNGGTIVNGGTLIVNNTTGSATGTNSVTVNDSGTLGGTGFIFGPVIVNSGGAISPGNNGIGQLTLKSNLTLNAGAVMDFDVGTASDKLAVSNALTLNGFFNVSNTAGFSFGVYTVMTYGGALSGSLPVVVGKPPGYSIVVNTNTAGQIRLIVQTLVSPVIGSVKLAGNKIVLSGNGSTNDFYYVLTATNLALPLAEWTPLATNRFGADGLFNFTNTIDSSLPQSYYRLQMP